MSEIISNQDCRAGRKQSEGVLHRKYDEWKDEEEIYVFNGNANDAQHLVRNISDELTCKTYSLYKDLSIKIKKVLACCRRVLPLTSSKDNDAI